MNALNGPPHLRPPLPAKTPLTATPCQQPTHKLGAGPPKSMLVRDQSNQQVNPGVVGPVDEDSSFALSCEVEPGEPIGSISWWRPSASSVAGAAPTVQQASRTGGGFVALRPSLAEAQFMATLAADGLADDGAQFRDHFLSLHSHPKELNSLQLGKHYRLKLWTKLTNSESLNSEGKLESTLQLHLNRSNLGDEFLCLAQNNQFMVPLNYSFRINLNRKQKSQSSPKTDGFPSNG